MRHAFDVTPNLNFYLYPGRSTCRNNAEWRQMHTQCYSPRILTNHSGIPVKHCINCPSPHELSSSQHYIHHHTTPPNPEVRSRRCKTLKYRDNHASAVTLHASDHSIRHIQSVSPIISAWVTKWMLVITLVRVELKRGFSYDTIMLPGRKTCINMTTRSWFKGSCK